MSEFRTVAKAGDIPEGQGRCFALDGTMVGVFLDQGRYFAINDFCPHMGASLSEGYVENGAVMCPWHAWRFSLCDGTWLDNSKSSIRTPCYEVRVEGDQIQVRMPAPIPAPAKPDNGSTPDSPANTKAGTSADASMGSEPVGDEHGTAEPDDAR